MLGELTLMFGNSRLNRIRTVAFMGFFCTLWWLVVKLVHLLHIQPNEIYMGFGLLGAVMWVWWTVRRLHDSETSAQFYLLMVAVFYGLLIVLMLLPSTAGEQSMPPMVRLTLIGFVSLLSMLLALYQIFVMLVAGDETPNKYGPVPPANNVVTLLFFVLFFLIAPVLGFEVMATYVQQPAVMKQIQS